MTDKLFSRVCEHFYKICEIPHGSGDMEKISDFCVDFAKKNNLKYVKDSACNVVIYKEASKGYENFEPIILQGHLDMVCQKENDIDFDFLTDKIKVLQDGDFLTADGTTLGADNGIAVAIIFAILENNELSHPAIEAVFTTDEEIGMIGATALDTSVLKSRKMINIDSEEDDTVTVSCAGGIDFTASLPTNYEEFVGTKISVTISGLKGGHSGVEIDKNRVNANVLMGKILKNLNGEFKLISINGGTKGNAIPNTCNVEICVKDSNVAHNKLLGCASNIKKEIAHIEENFKLDFEIHNEINTFSVLTDEIRDKIIYALLLSPNGIIDMSAEIMGLVETSLNLGILATESDKITFHYALRSNKNFALAFLMERLELFYKTANFTTHTGGFYPPWEYNSSSKLQEIYCNTYKEIVGQNPKVEAIHAGLECAVFSGSIKELDCISIGPSLFDVHTVNERMSLSSTKKLLSILIKMLENCKF